jgi:hypothetical protein
MKNYFSVLIVLALAIAVSQAFFLRSPQLSKDYHSSFAVHSEEPKIQFNQVQKWFDSQLIDHFNPQDSRLYSQRYWVVSDYYKQGGPVFLYICGEYTCPGVNQERLYPVQLAQKYNALFVVLEHRFYGLSQPFGDLKTANLAYLTVDQALEDLAYFIQWFKVQGGYGLTDNKWITIGGSYPGAMSAWFRYKYPHLTVGAWASSAVVDAILDFPDFDHQIFVSTNRSSPQCPQIIQNLTAYYESQLYDASPDVQKAFQAKFGDNALKLSREELLWFIADMFVETVQYGSRRSMCANLTSYSNWDQLLAASIDFINTGDPRGYGSYFLKNDTFDPATMDLGRQWMWQVCSEFGWLQTPATNSQYSMRSKRINLDFYKQYCHDIFGIPIWPKPNLVNLELGGLNLQATNLVMFNGAEDPWQWASKLNSTSTIQSVYIDCADCAHCVELYTPKADDAQVLKDARITIDVNIAKWLSA